MIMPWILGVLVIFFGVDLTNVVQYSPAGKSLCCRKIPEIVLTAFYDIPKLKYSVCNRDSHLQIFL